MSDNGEAPAHPPTSELIPQSWYRLLVMGTFALSHSHTCPQGSIWSSPILSSHYSLLSQSWGCVRNTQTLHYFSWSCLLLSYCWWAFVVTPCPRLTANRWTPFTIGMMLNYSATQLRKFKNCTTPTCISIIEHLGLLPRRRCIHRSSRWKFVHSQSVHSIPSLWSAACTVMSHPRHQYTVSPHTSSHGNTEWAKNADWISGSQNPRIPTHER